MYSQDSWVGRGTVAWEFGSIRLFCALEAVVNHQLQVTTACPPDRRRAVHSAQTYLASHTARWLQWILEGCEVRAMASPERGAVAVQMEQVTFLDRETGSMDPETDRLYSHDP
jgi:hypothetical protein